MSAGKYSEALLEKNRWAMSALLYIYVGMCAPVSVPEPVSMLQGVHVCVHVVTMGSCLSWIYVSAACASGRWRYVGLCLQWRKKMSVPSCRYANVLEESKCFPHSPGDWTVAILTGWANQLFLSLPGRTWVFASNQAGYASQDRTWGYKWSWQIIFLR